VKAPEAPSAASGGRDHTVPAQRLNELKTLASRQGLEVHLEELDHNAGVVIQFIQPGTGEVVREFPPESLVRTLAELRAAAAGRLDRQA
jgi:uncharacterized FlaG/YvyC family protein